MFFSPADNSVNYHNRQYNAARSDIGQAGEGIYISVLLRGWDGESVNEHQDSQKKKDTRDSLE